MAVPNSGSLSMQDIAQERLNSTYGSGNVSGPISMYNLINGGNTGGAVTSGNNYPAVNTGCSPNPHESVAGNVLQNLGITCGMQTVNDAYFKSSEAANATQLQNGDTLYANRQATAPWVPGHGFNISYQISQFGTSSNDTIAGNGDEASFFVNSSGVISNLTIH